MHYKLHEQWKDVLATRGHAVALIDAESGKSRSFDELERLACEWLVANESLQLCAGQVWCLALSDRITWLAVFLAAIKTGAVVLPLEPAEASVLAAQARQQSAAFLIDDVGVHPLQASSAREGYLLVKLTSGTTGAPKALPFTESEMMADGGQIMRSMSISDKDRNYAIIPLGHSYGLGNLVMPFFMAGVPMVLGSSPFPQVMVEEMTQFPCTVLPLVPPLIKALARVTLEHEQLKQLRLVISAGSALDAKIAERFTANTGLPVHNFYGSSETGGICFDRTGTQATVLGAVGTVMECVQLSVDSTQSIQVSSDAVCHAVYPDGVCVLHDSGSLDADCVLHLLGRHSDIVKIAGRRISLSEIESAICSVPDVTDAYVSSRVGRSGELRCVALFTGTAEVSAVKAALLASMPEWKLPKTLREVDEILYNARGKKDRPAMERVIDAAIAR